MIFRDMDKGRWTLFHSRVIKGESELLGLESHDFTYDVVLRVSGDFGGPEVKQQYCELLATALNNATKMEARIAELEAVAEAAEVYSHLNGKGTCDELAAYYAASDKLDAALRAAGYLGDKA